MIRQCAHLGMEEFREPSDRSAGEDSEAVRRAEVA